MLVVSAVTSSSGSGLSVIVVLLYCVEVIVVGWISIPVGHER